MATPTPPPVTLAEADAWWLAVRCRCGRLTLLPCRMLARELRPSRSVDDVAKRLRCRACGGRPQAVDLVDNPQAGARGYVASGGSRRVPLIG